MSSAKTTNLQLNTWSQADDVLMDEFNSNFTKLDDKFSKDITVGHIHTGVAGQGPRIDAANISFASSGFTSTNLKAAIDELFTDANSKRNSIAAAIGYTPTTGDTIPSVVNKLVDGKQALIEAVNERGEDIPSSSSLIDIANKIKAVGWPVASYGNATMNDVAYGRTFLNNDSSTNLITGAVPDRGIIQFDATTKDYTISPGYYGKGTILKGYAELQSYAIVRGKSMFGINGIYDPAPGYRIGDDLPRHKIIQNRKYNVTPEWTLNTGTTYGMFMIDKHIIIVHKDPLIADRSLISKYNLNGVLLYEKIMNGAVTRVWQQYPDDVCVIAGGKIYMVDMNKHVIKIDGITFKGNAGYETTIFTNPDIVLQIASQNVYTYNFSGDTIRESWSSSMSRSKVISYNSLTYVNTLHIGSHNTVDEFYSSGQSGYDYYRSSNFDSYTIDDNGFLYAWDNLSKSIDKIDTSVPYGQIISTFYVPFASSAYQSWSFIGNGFFRNIRTYQNGAYSYKYTKCDKDFNPVWAMEPQSNDLTKVADDNDFIYIMDSNSMSKYGTYEQGYQII